MTICILQQEKADHRMIKTRLANYQMTMLATWQEIGLEVHQKLIIWFRNHLK
jgi:hypothetical protein